MSSRFDSRWLIGMPEIVRVDMNAKIIKLWESTSPEVRGCYLPSLYPEGQQNREILFVGINPALNQRYLELLRTPPAEVNQDITRQVIAEYEEALEKYDRYYGKYKKISKRVNATWVHRDLFLIRNGIQGELAQRVTTKVGRRRGLNDFGIAQLKLFCDTIYSLNPKVVLIANKYASDILKKYSYENIGYGLSGSDEINSRYIHIREKKFPIIFDRAFQGWPPSSWIESVAIKIEERLDKR